MPCFVIDLDDTLVNTTRDLRGNHDLIPSLTLVEGAREFLAKHGETSVILSAGVHRIQQSKIDAVGVRQSVRHVVIVPGFDHKCRLLAKFVKASEMPVSSIVVVGDRLDQEIQVGNELGCSTVRMHLPEGKYYGDIPLMEVQRPQYTVANFVELMKLPLKF